MSEQLRTPSKTPDPTTTEQKKKEEELKKKKEAEAQEKTKQDELERKKKDEEAQKKKEQDELEKKKKEEAAKESERQEEEEKKKKEEEKEEARAKFIEKYSELQETHINRIRECSDDEHWRILNVDSNADEGKLEFAWKALGDLLHPKHCPQDTDGACYKKVKNAAVALGVDQIDIDATDNWDEEGPLGGVDDYGKDAEPLEAEDIPEPPDWVKEIYVEATADLRSLSDYPGDMDLTNHLEELNEQIFQQVKIENESREPKHKLPADIWTIKWTAFQKNFVLLQEVLLKLKDDPTNAEANAKLQDLNKFLTLLIKHNHYPEQWNTASKYLPIESIEGGDDKSGKNDISTIERMDYPWNTLDLGDCLVLGLRAAGSGYRVLIEEVEDGRLIRKHKSAAEVNKGAILNWADTKQYTNLAKDFGTFSHKDIKKFKELYWITKSPVLLKNVESGSKTGVSTCCVNMDGRIVLMPLSQFTKVLGKGQANKEVKKVCKRDNIHPPWDAGYVSYYHDFSRTAAARGHEEEYREKQSQENPSQREFYRNRASQQNETNTYTTPQPDKKEEDFSKRMGNIEEQMQKLSVQVLEARQDQIKSQARTDKMLMESQARTDEMFMKSQAKMEEMLTKFMSMHVKEAN